MNGTLEFSEEKRVEYMNARWEEQVQRDKKRACTVRCHKQSRATETWSEWRGRGRKVSEGMRGPTNSN